MQQSLAGVSDGVRCGEHRKEQYAVKEDLSPEFCRFAYIDALRARSAREVGAYHHKKIYGRQKKGAEQFYENGAHGVGHSRILSAVADEMVPYDEKHADDAQQFKGSVPPRFCGEREQFVTQASLSAGIAALLSVMKKLNMAKQYYARVFI